MGRFSITPDRFATPITEVHIMSIVVRFSPIALTANKYDDPIRQIRNAGEWPPAGLDYHVCFGSDGNHLRNEQYRVTFGWEKGHAYEVLVEDYR
jgi:hypothetical protein